VSKALINNTSLAEIFIAVSQNDGGLPTPNLTIHAILEAEATASLVDAKLFTPEAAVILTKGSRKFINKLIEQNNDKMDKF
jgi:hypothetical protein